MTTSPEGSAIISTALGRRAVLTGAAWAVPAIAAGVAAPVASASEETALTFDRATYSGTVCAAITGAYVTVTVNGIVAEGTGVTINTPSGYRFENGASTFTGLSDTIGRVSVPAIRVGVGGTTGTLTAMTTGATTTATLTAPTSSTNQTMHRRMWTDTGAPHSAGTIDLAVPTGSRAVGTLVTLDPAGVLRRAGSTVTSGVTSTYGELEKSNYLTVTYVDSTGMHRRMWTDTGVVYPSAKVDATIPVNSLARGTFVTLDPGGVLRRVTTTIATGVTSAFAELDKNNDLNVTYVGASGMHRRMWTAAGTVYAAGSLDITVPADSVAVGTLVTLGSDGALRKGSKTFATGVTSAFGELDMSKYLNVTYVDADGMHRRMWTDAGVEYSAGYLDATVPSDSTAVGTLVTLSSNGTLRKGTDTVSTGVTSAFAELDKDDYLSVTYVDGEC